MVIFLFHIKPSLVAIAFLLLTDMNRKKPPSLAKGSQAKA